MADGEAYNEAEDKPLCMWLVRGGGKCIRFAAKGKKYCGGHITVLQRNSRDLKKDDTRRLLKVPKGAIPNPFGSITITGKKAKGSTLATVFKSERMGFYAKKVGPKLNALITEALETYKANDISEEITLTRVVATQSVQMYSQLLELPDSALPLQARQQILAEAGAMVTRSMEQATRLVERSAKIFALTTDKIDPSAVDAVVKQICRFVYLCFETYKTNQPGYEEFDAAVNKIMVEGVQKFDKMLNEELQLPSLKQLGTSITPDQQTLAMIDTVPFVDEE